MQITEDVDNDIKSECQEEEARQRFNDYLKDLLENSRGLVKTKEQLKNEKGILKDEMALQKYFVKELRYFIEYQNLGIYILNNKTGEKGLLKNKRNKEMGQLAGVPDIQLLLPNCKLIFIEFKNPNKNITMSSFSKDQIQFLPEFKKGGWEVFVCNSPKGVDFIKTLITTKMILPNSVIYNM